MCRAALETMPSLQVQLSIVLSLVKPSYPLLLRDCKRASDLYAALQRASRSESAEQRRLAAKAKAALIGANEQAASDLFIALHYIDSPLAYSFDFRNFEAWFRS